MRERGVERNVRLDGLYLGLVKVGGDATAFANIVETLVIQMVCCRVFAIIRMKFWAVDRIETIAV